jgi:hypothetical protein
MLDSFDFLDKNMVQAFLKKCLYRILFNSKMVIPFSNQCDHLTPMCSVLRRAVS